MMYKGYMVGAPTIECDALARAPPGSLAFGSDGQFGLGWLFDLSNFTRNRNIHGRLEQVRTHQHA